MIRLDPRLHAVRPDLADYELKGQVQAERFVRGENLRVVAGQAPVRRAPAADAMLLTEVLIGEEVSVFDRSADGEWAWAQLRSDRYVGWMPSACLAPNGAEPTHKVCAPRTLSFSKPDIKAPPVATLPLGARVAVTGEAQDRNARYALLERGGAVVIQHLAPLDVVERDWTAVAERFLGTPYLWGGKTALGVDCSGLVQVALQACGIVTPRDSDMQEAAMGTALPLGSGDLELRRGDLVFWDGHVGIMQDGRQLLHANAHHMAVAAEPLSVAVERLAGRGAPITSIRRIEAL